MPGRDGSLPGRGDRQGRLSRLSRLNQPLLWFARILLGVLVIHLLCRPDIQGDTIAAIHEATHQLACLRAGGWGHCAGDAAQFPPFQVVPAMGITAITQALGLSTATTDEIILRLFALVSMVAFWMSLRLFWLTLSPRDPRVARLGILIYLSGFGLFYVNSSYSELPASALMLAVVACILRAKSTLRIALLFVTAALTKEIAAPFLLSFAGLALWARDGRLDWRELLAPTRARNKTSSAAGIARAVLGAALGALLIHVACNEFKFSSPVNQKYLTPYYIVRDSAAQLSFFFAIWLSPTSGLLVAWPTFLALLGAIAAVLAKQPGAKQLEAKQPAAKRIQLSRAITLAGVAGLLGIATLGFSRWFAPFGWIAWGPRLMLPWIPACLLLLLYDYTPELSRLLDAARTRPRTRVILAAGLGLVALPNLRAVLYRGYQQRVIEIPGCHDVAIEQGVDRYLTCIRDMAWPWPHSWGWLQTYAVFPRPDLLAISAFYGLMLGLALHRLLAGQPGRARDLC